MISGIRFGNNSKPPSPPDAKPAPGKGAAKPGELPPIPLNKPAKGKEPVAVPEGNPDKKHRTCFE